MLTFFLNSIMEFEVIQILQFCHWFRICTTLELAIIIIFFFIAITLFIIRKDVGFYYNWWLSRVEYFLFSIFDYILENASHLPRILYSITFIILCFFIACGNIFALFPFVTGVTAYFSVTFFFGGSFILSYIIKSFWLRKTNFLENFIPIGVPFYLLPIIIPVEMISYFSKIISLTVRIFVNMTSGHILISSLADFVVLFLIEVYPHYQPVSLIYSIFVVICLFFVYIFEVLASLLQIIIFCVLVNIYFADATR